MDLAALGALMTSLNRAEQFLDAFSSIERELRRLTNEDKNASFSHLLNKAKKSNAIVARLADDLRQLSDLRNAIVHERREGEPIADPREATVAEIRQIEELLLGPPKVTDLPHSEVVLTTSSETIGNAAQRMYDGDFSQLPVYDDGKWSGLLTAETIARWVASKLEGGIGLLEEETVAQVLEFREDTSIERFLPRTASVFDVLVEFDDAMHAGKNLDALFITETGNRNQTPLRILTVFDLPLIYQAAGQRY